jgi:hypothetical protein
MDRDENSNQLPPFSKYTLQWDVLWILKHEKKCLQWFSLLKWLLTFPHSNPNAYRGNAGTRSFLKMYNLHIIPVYSHLKLPSPDPHFVTPDIAHQPLSKRSDHNASPSMDGSGLWWQSQSSVIVKVHTDAFISWLRRLFWLRISERERHPLQKHTQKTRVRRNLQSQQRPFEDAKNGWAIDPSVSICETLPVKKATSVWSRSPLAGASGVSHIRSGIANIVHEPVVLD